jgi:hypothetical protein
MKVSLTWELYQYDQLGIPKPDAFTNIFDTIKTYFAGIFLVMNLFASAAFTFLSEKHVDKASEHIDKAIGYVLFFFGFLILGLLIFIAVNYRKATKILMSDRKEKQCELQKLAKAGLTQKDLRINERMPEAISMKAF